MKKILLSILLGTTLTLPTSSFSQMATEESTKELIEITNAANIGLMFIDQMLPHLKSQGATDEQLAEIKELFKKEDLVNLIYPIYQKHFNEEEIQATIAFYKTPAGQKMIEKLPVLMQESNAAGQEWGASLIPKMQAILQK